MALQQNSIGVIQKLPFASNTYCLERNVHASHTTATNKKQKQKKQKQNKTKNKTKQKTNIKEKPN